MGDTEFRPGTAVVGQDHRLLRPPGILVLERHGRCSARGPPGWWGTNRLSAHYSEDRLSAPVQTAFWRAWRRRRGPRQAMQVFSRLALGPEPMRIPHPAWQGRNCQTRL